MKKTIPVLFLLLSCLLLPLFVLFGEGDTRFGTGALIADALASMGLQGAEGEAEEVFGEGGILENPSFEEPLFRPDDEALSALSTSAGHAALLTDDGRLLYGKNENERAGMASTTKIMTALLAAEYIEEKGLETEIVVPAATAGIEGSSVYLKAGERVRLLDLLYATLLASANDGAATLAVAVAGDIDSFVERMNERAEELGLVNTHFINPHGISDEEHYTTAYELGILAAHAMQNELFAKVCATKNYTFAGEGITRSLTNHNRMLFSYPGAIGVKTGFTKATGRCLVTAAERDGVRLIAVTLDASDDWNDHRAMLDHGFSLLEAVTLASAGEHAYTLPVVNGSAATVDAVNRETLSLVLRRDHGVITFSVELPSFLYAGIQEGDLVGRVIFYENGKKIGEIPLTAESTVDSVEYEKSFGERLKSLLGLS